MNGSEIANELRRRGRTELFHACTLTTFESYCRLGAYRSRAAIEAAGLPMTTQYSDAIDKHLGVWNDLFLNLFDQHGDVHRGKSVTGLNKFGPLCLTFDVAALVGVDGEFLAYSREISSQHYDAKAHDISSLDELRHAAFADPSPNSTLGAPSRRPGTPGPNTCVHVPDGGEGISLARFGRTVIIDRLPSTMSALEDEMLLRLRALMSSSMPTATLVRRDCIPTCGCHEAYPLLGPDVTREFFIESTVGVAQRRLPRQARGK